MKCYIEKIMKEKQISSFWINITGGIATVGISYIITTIFPRYNVIEYIGILIVVGFIILTAIWAFNQLFGIKYKDKIQFITEGVKLTPDGFRVLFSIWNNDSASIKLYEFFTKEYIRQTSVRYYGGQRNNLEIKQNETTLWKGETFTIRQNESESFDLKYIVDTGPIDGRPWILFGLLVNYHDINGKKVLHSDTIYLYRDNEVIPININNLKELDEPNMFIHRIYVEILQELGDNLPYNHGKVIKLLINEYKMSFRVLRDLIFKENQIKDIKKFMSLKYNLLNIINFQKKSHVNKEMLDKKKKVLDELDNLSRKYALCPFRDLSQAELNLDYLDEYSFRNEIKSVK